MTPGLSLTGVRLSIPARAVGLPVLRALSLCTCRRHYPGAAAGRIPRSITQSYQPSPKGLSGRPAHRPFRGLLSVHSRYGLHTRAATNSWPAIPRSDRFSGKQTFELLPGIDAVGGAWHRRCRNNPADPGGFRHHALWRHGGDRDQQMSATAAHPPDVDEGDPCRVDAK
jgi:hypothetical protein